MTSENIPQKVVQFILESIDSVEQLEILLLLRRHPNEPWTAQAISQELRSSPTSINLRLSHLVRGRIVEQCEMNFSYNPDSQFEQKIAKDLAEAYRVRRVKVLELIFSPMKKARPFADAFRVIKSKEPDSNG